MKFEKRVMKFGSLTVMSGDLRRKVNGHYSDYWLCKCDCGKTILVQIAMVKDGRRKSCGCGSGRCYGEGDRRHTHGLTHTRIYSIWNKMRQRCENPNNKKYPNYGARGIEVCERWHDVANFYEDMGDPPEDRTLNRINNDGNYEPSNCEWATAKEQANNKTNNQFFAYQGGRKTISQLAEICGMDHQTLYHRLMIAKIPLQEAMALPVKELTLVNKRDALHEYEGQQHTLKEWAAIRGLDYKTLHARMATRGRTLAEALSMGRSRQQTQQYLYQGQLFEYHALAAHLGITLDALYGRLKRKAIDAELIG